MSTGSILSRLSLTAVVFAMAVVALMYLMQERLLFPGAYSAADDPALRARIANEQGITERRLTTLDGDRILAWHQDTGADRIVLYVGGNFSTIENAAPLMARLADAGWDTFTIAPRGWPGSEGTPSERALEQDLRAAWSYITGPLRIPPSRVVLHGRSLGGGIVGTMMADVRPAGIVMESTFDAIAPIAKARFPWLPVGLLLKHRFESVHRAHRVRAPVFQAHSRVDETIPVARAVALSTAFLDVELHLVDGLPHNTSVLLDEATQPAWLAFLDRVAPSTSETR